MANIGSGDTASQREPTAQPERLAIRDVFWDTAGPLQEVVRRKLRVRSYFIRIKWTAGINVQLRGPSVYVTLIRWLDTTNSSANTFVGQTVAEHRQRCSRFSMATWFIVSVVPVLAWQQRSPSALFQSLQGHLVHCQRCSSFRISTDINVSVVPVLAWSPGSLSAMFQFQHCH